MIESSVISAIRSGDAAYVKEALELGLNPSLPDALDRNLPILFTALRNGRFEIARLLVK